ncbi:MAG: thiamine pyrophosphate-binding protein [Caldilineaceae bacterium]
MKGAQMVWEALVREGVDLIFGHPGGAILPTYDALSPYEAEGRIHHVLVRHEQCAAHMAKRLRPVTGRVGVCIATSGPGATNLVTGLARPDGQRSHRCHHGPGADQICWAPMRFRNQTWWA